MPDPVTIAILAAAGFKYLIDGSRWCYHKYQDYKESKKPKDDNEATAGIPIRIEAGNTKLMIATDNHGATKVSIDSVNKDAGEDHDVIGDILLDSSESGRAFLAAQIVSSAAPSHHHNRQVAEITMQPEKAGQAQEVTIRTNDPKASLVKAEVGKGAHATAIATTDNSTALSGVHHRKTHDIEKSKLHNSDKHHESKEKLSWFSGFTSSVTEKVHTVVNVFERLFDKISSHVHSGHSSCYDWDGYGTPASITAFNEYFSKQLPLGGSGDFLLPEGAEVHAEKNMQGVVTVTGSTPDHLHNDDSTGSVLAV